MGNRVVSKRLMEIGERIRERRQTLRWSQEKLAEMADVSLNTVSRIEGGQRLQQKDREVVFRTVDALVDALSDDISEKA